ncbi:MAG: MmgE/PrpD family protein [Chloroflexota bacterium]
MEKNDTLTLAEFCAGAKFYDLPARVIREVKRIFLDAVGCALGATDLDKGRIAVEVAKALGGKPEAAILGSSERVAITGAAFANGELMQTLDFTSMLPPAHVTAFVTPAPLALVGARRVTGRELILALALGHEIAARLGTYLGSIRHRKDGFPPRSYGFGGNTFGAAAGAAKILKLDAAQTANALGVAGYFTPLPAYTKWLHTPGNGMAQYGSAGWTAQSGLTAALLAERGYAGDKTMLDGEYGFWVMHGAEVHDRKIITHQLGSDWVLLQTGYKYWPCSDVFASALDAFHSIITKNNLIPENIDRVVVRAEGVGTLPRFRTLDIATHLEAQTNLPYNVAAVAHRLIPGPQWQAKSTLEDPGIREFMKKVSYESYAHAEETRYQELVVEGKPFISRRPASVEVIAGSQRFSETVEYAKWLSTGTDKYRASETELADKFRVNAAVLKDFRIDKALAAINSLENLDDAGSLLRLLTV